MGKSVGLFGVASLPAFCAELASGTAANSIELVTILRSIFTSENKLIAE